MRPDIDVDDEAAVGLLDVDVTVQGVQRRRFAELGFRRPSETPGRTGRAVMPGMPLGLAAELRILVEMGVLDRLQQHAVRGDQARLAFDHHGETRKVLSARREFAIDQLQFAGIDIELSGRTIFRRQALADRHRRAGADQRGHSDRDPLPPQQADELQHAEGRGASLAPPCGRPAGPDLSVGHRSSMSPSFHSNCRTHRLRGHSSGHARRGRSFGAEQTQQEKLTILSEGLFTEMAKKAFKRLCMVTPSLCPENATFDAAKSPRGNGKLTIR